ncbi:hypothetical protein GW742_17995 [Citrobacter freundii]|nr:hypothetical protein [Citrobacter freundii]MBC6508321.1 hypothetical protein [Citrobacter freundii]
MAKVIFEFIRSNVDAPASMEGIAISVKIDDVSKGEDGPHICLAHIINSMAPVVIKEASSELLKALNQMGADASGELYQMVKH